MTTCACKRRLFRVENISLRIHEYKHGIKRRIDFCYYFIISLLGVFLFSATMNCSPLRSVITLCHANSFSKRSSDTFAQKVDFMYLGAYFVKFHVILEDIQRWHSSRCVFYIPSQEAQRYKTRDSFHNTSCGMTIHLRSFINVMIITFFLPWFVFFLSEFG